MARQGSPGKSAESFGKTIAGQPGILHTLFSPDWRIFSKEMKTHSGCIVVVSGSVHFTLTLRQSVFEFGRFETSTLDRFGGSVELNAVFTGLPAHWHQKVSESVWCKWQSSLIFL